MCYLDKESASLDLVKSISPSFELWKSLCMCVHVYGVVCEWPCTHDGMRETCTCVYTHIYVWTCVFDIVISEKKAFFCSNNQTRHDAKKSWEVRPEVGEKDRQLEAANSWQGKRPSESLYEKTESGFQTISLETSLPIYCKNKAPSETWGWCFKDSQNSIMSSQGRGHSLFSSGNHLSFWKKTQTPIISFESYTVLWNHSAHAFVSQESTDDL